jgi:hypothetical protein
VREYVVDVSDATSCPDFIAAFDRDFVCSVGGSGWNGDLDALNDYLF